MSVMSIDTTKGTRLIGSQLRVLPLFWLGIGALTLVFGVLGCPQN